MKTLSSLGILLISCAAPASAVVIPPASFNASYYYIAIDQYHYSFGPGYGNGSSGDGAAIITAQSNPAGQFGIPKANAEANPFGIVSATATVTGVEGWRASGNAWTKYFLAVTGVSYDTIVPISYIAKLSTSISGSGADWGTADANLSIDWDLGDNSNISFRASNSNAGIVGYNESKTYSGSFRTHGNSLIRVDQSAAAWTDNAGGATAYVDPFFAIDPDFLTANPNARLEFSAYIENAPIDTAVPEPATWALMLAGFALAAGTLRVRRTRIRFA